MKILITGIAGFIGFHAARHFKKLGHEIYGLDNYSDYYDSSLKYRRAEILRDEDIRVEKCDIRRTDELTFLIDNIKRSDSQ